MKNIIFIAIGLLILTALLWFANADANVNIDESSEIADVESGFESESKIVEFKTNYDFTVEDTEGQLIKRSEITGKPMVVHFWASWYDYCDYELPAIQAMYEKYGDIVEFMIVCITDGEYETVESAKEYLSDKGYTFPVYFDVNREALENYALYKFTTTHRTYLFDMHGNYKLRSQKMIEETMLENGILRILPQENTEK
jgi:thiol-disulfide isomerase/thioredoxin